MQRVQLTVIMICLITIIGCKKDLSQQAPRLQPDPALTDSLPTSSDDRLLIENLRKLTDVLKVLYLEKSNLKIVNAAIFAHAYTDESILVKDLIYPNYSRLNNNKIFKEYMTRWNLNLDRFADNFWKEVAKKDDENFHQFLTGISRMDMIFENGSGVGKPSSSRTNLMSDEVTIYSPYSEERMPPIGYYEPITTLVAATADADQGIGYQPYYINGIFQEYREVLVDDDYAYNNPTQIIGVNGVEPYDATLTVNSAFPPQSAIDIPHLTREVKQVYVGDILIQERQYDKLISFTGNGGGSEIRFTRADGFLKVVDGQVQTADLYYTPAKDISRRNIRNSIWVDASYEWDGDWELNNLQQNLAIYEEDNRNTSTFTGSLVTNVNASIPPVTVMTSRTLGFTINYKSDDELIRQINFNRDIFFILNRTNLEGEMHNGWPVRDRNGPVSYTLNDRTLY